MKQKRKALYLILCLLLIACLGGCKPSKKKVEKSSYYQELLEKYNKLKDENKELKKQNENQEKESQAEERAEERAQNFLAKIARDSLVKMEIGFADSMEDSIVIDQAGMLDIATNLANKADLTNKFNAEQLKDDHELVYEYILYDENNAIYEMMIYDADYVVFSDLPELVYYVPGAAVLGDALLPLRMNYPSSTPLHRLADSLFMSDSKDRIYERDVVVQTAVYIRGMKKDKTNREKVENAWKKNAGFEDNDEADIYDYEPDSMTYTYYIHGNEVKLVMYEKYFCIKDVDGEESWYKASKDQIQGIKDILKKDREAREAANKNQKKNASSSNESSHADEIANESILTE